MRTLLTLLAFCIAAIGTAPQPPGAQDAGVVAQSVQPVVLRIDWTPKSIKYSVDGRRGKDVLTVLEDVRSALGQAQPVIAIVDDRVALLHVSSAHGLLGKAGLSNIRIFANHVENQTMTEVTSGSTILVPARPKRHEVQVPNKPGSNPK